VLDIFDTLDRLGAPSRCSFCDIDLKEYVLSTKLEPLVVECEGGQLMRGVLYDACDFRERA
jgi:hypothetical protein